MPIYEYQCQDCGHELDALQKISDPPLVDCPACNASQLRKKISAPQFRLKGSGWYETDFKKDRRRNLADSPEGSGDKKTEGAGEGKKPDADAGKKADGKSAAGKDSGGKQNASAAGGAD